jgi:hypothetical protein
MSARYLDSDVSDVLRLNLGNRRQLEYPEARRLILEGAMLNRGFFKGFVKASGEWMLQEMGKEIGLSEAELASIRRFDGNDPTENDQIIWVDFDRRANWIVLHLFWA